MAAAFPTTDMDSDSLNGQATVPDLRTPWPRAWLTVPIVLFAILSVIRLCIPRKPQLTSQLDAAHGNAQTPAIAITEGSHLATSYAVPSDPWMNKMDALRTALSPHIAKLGEPQPGDWLSAHPEAGQTFAEYLRASPIRPTRDRHTLYVQPIGPFSDTQWRVLAHSAAFLSHYFRLPVRTNPPRSLHSLPPASGRDHLGGFQLHTRTLLARVLYPDLPTDAAALLGLTSIDLYPHESWNFVFGEATFSARVGVWSLARFGNPDFGPAFFHKVLRRTLGTAAHETGHMFGMAHCTKHHCIMNGSNSLDESDRAPLTLCADCLAKLMWLTSADPLPWVQDIERFLHEQGLDEDAAQFAEQASLLTSIQDGRLPS